MCWDNRVCTCKRMKLGFYHIPYTKVNLKYTIELNVRAKTIKLLEENMDINLCDLGLGTGFLDRITKTQAATAKQWTNWTS